jgi:subtilase family protein
MKAPRSRWLLAGTAVLLLAAPASASARAIQPPMVLPGDAAAASVRAASSTWIVGARPGAAAQAIAARFSARAIGPRGTGGYVLAPSRARAFAAALRERGLLVYAQPDTIGRFLSVPDDPMSGGADAWRAFVADPAIDPPPVTPTSPLIALVDAQLDATHPEFAGSNTTTIPKFGVTISHGTATASVAAAPVNGLGIVGVWPNARALNVPLPEEITCSASADGIGEAADNGAAVINMSYGSPSACFAEYAAIQFAVKRGIVPVAAAGNELDQGNPLEFPASLPHVVTVAAIGPDGKGTGFSNANAAVDLSAPGVGIMTAVPIALDQEAPADGYEHQSGTSFSAPMVAAGIAWLRQARPTLTPDRVVQAMRLSAIDTAPAGWDPATGFGVMNMTRALAFNPPPQDRDEPNDEVVWVNGDAFGKANPLLFKGRKRAKVKGLLDVFEDPADVYRIKVRGHRTVKITAKPGGPTDDITLAVYKRKAKELTHPLKKSAHKGRHKTERIRLHNGGRRPKTYYVATEVQGTRDLDAAYVLRVG